MIKIVKKFNIILSKHQKVRIIELFFLMILGGVLETLSVALMMPFMDALINPDGFKQKWYGRLVCDMFHVSSEKTMFLVLAIALAALYIFKNVYLMFEYSIQYRFVYGNMFALQRRLLDVFIHRPYEYFLNVNSGEIIRVITSDTTSAFDLLVIALNLATELVVSIMLIGAIFIITPFVTICIASLLLLLLTVIFVFVKPMLRKAAKNQQKSAAGMNKWLLQSIHGIKELKVMAKESFFQNNYGRYGSIYVDSMRWNKTLQITPRFIIEGVSMGAMFVVVAVMISMGVEIETLIPTLTAVAMAAVRLLPATNRISGAMTSLAYGEPMLDKVIENLSDANIAREKIKHSELCKEPAEHKSPVLAREIILSNVKYRYPDAEESVLIGASMNIKKGESVGIVGSSGSGKTTSVDIILGLLKPQKGTVFVDGVDINNDIPSWLKQIGYIPQMIFMLDDSIRANVAFGEESIDDNAVWRALKGAALDGFVRDLPNGLDTQIGERGVRLSGGQRQRIGIARALYRDPEVLIFDEATSALDNETEKAIMESINGLHGSKTMIIIAHRLTTIESCDKVFRVENGIITKERGSSGVMVGKKCHQPQCLC